MFELRTKEKAFWDLFYLTQIITYKFYYPKYIMKKKNSSSAKVKPRNIFYLIGLNTFCEKN